LLDTAVRLETTSTRFKCMYVNGITVPVTQMECLSQHRPKQTCSHTSRATGNKS